jgi:hypothetical protein
MFTEIQVFWLVNKISFQYCKILLKQKTGNLRKPNFRVLLQDYVAIILIYQEVKYLISGWPDSPFKSSAWRLVSTLSLCHYQAY